MNQKRTDKVLLLKGLKRLALALPVLIATTYAFTFGFLNKETLPLWIFMCIGILLMALTFYLLFDGIKKIIRSIF